MYPNGGDRSLGIRKVGKRSQDGGKPRSGRRVETSPVCTHYMRALLTFARRKRYNNTHIMRRTYLWEREPWPAFTYQADQLIGPLSSALVRFGTLSGLLMHANVADRGESEIRALVADVVDTSAIEGEKLDPEAVRGSIVRRLSLADGGVRRADDHTEGVIDITMDALKYERPVTEQRLFDWHEMLFPIVRGHRALRNIGRYRDDGGGPMTVQTNRGAGREPTIHYAAPPASQVPGDMKRLIDYVETDTGEHGVIRAAIVHLWFLLIHPFEDGNGRIGRALADLMLSRAQGQENRYCSLSRQILIDQKAYYEALERAGYESFDITQWVAWFLDCYARAAEATIGIVNDVLRTTTFFATFADIAMNERQRKIVKRLLDGFDGRLNAERYARMTSVSHDTANRDLSDLVEKGVFVREGESRKTNYRLSGV